LIKDFLAKNNMTTLEHPPYFPDLAPADFYLFPRLLSTLKRWRFYDATDIIKNATEELKRFVRVSL
jgi:transposase